MDIFRTMIVPAGHVELARFLAATIDPANSSNMFVTELSESGREPATHYVSSGHIAESFAAPLPLQTWRLVTPENDEENGMIVVSGAAWVIVDSQPGDAAFVAARANEILNPPPPPVYDEDGNVVPQPPVAPVVYVTTEQVQALFDGSDVTMQEPFVALDRRGLRIVGRPLDE